MFLLTLCLAVVCVGSPLSEGEEVEMRGFLYRTRGGELILASEPDLRTCCLQKGPHLEIEGVPSECAHGQAVTLKAHVSGGRLVHAQLLEGNPYPTRTLALTGALALLIGGGLYWKRQLGPGRARRS